MAISGTYAVAPVASNPGSDLTDYVALVDLADLPQSWWDEVDTSDSTKGRAAKDDETELASEWVDFDDVAQTGFVWVKWSGTLPSASGGSLRIYPPKTANDSYAVTDTFGRNAVWDKYAGVYHMHDLVDVTGNNANAVSSGGQTVGGATGKLGSATQFDGSDDFWDLGHGAETPVGSTNFIMQGWGFLDTKGLDRYLVGKSDGNNSGPELRYDVGDDFWEFSAIDSVFKYAKYTQATASTGVWVHLVAVRSGTDMIVYVNGVAGSEIGTVGTITNASLDWMIGALNSGSRFWDGIIDEVRVGYFAKSADFISYEYSNQNNPTTFWDTWEFSVTDPTVTVWEDAAKTIPAEGVYVRFFEVDAIDAEALALSAISYLGAATSTDVNGVATTATAPTAGQVVGALILSSDYDAGRDAGEEWHFAQHIVIGSENVDLTAPA